MVRVRSTAVVSAFLAASFACAQNTGPKIFDVASIKPSSPDEHGTYIRPAAGGISITNMTLKELIVLAYRVQPFQVSGGPAWLDSLHYDIQARSNTPVVPGQLNAPLQALLADRFQLKVHEETKELPIYRLVLARKDGKLGAGLVGLKEGDCQRPDPLHPPVQDGAPHHYCGGMSAGQGRISGTGMPISDLVPVLSRMIGRTVVDETALKGDYNIDVEWMPDDSQVFPPRPPNAPAVASDATGPSIFTAFHDSLGLKLESARGPVETIVVESAQKPSEN